MKYLKFGRYLLPFWRKEILVLILGASGVLLNLINPYLAKLLIDKAYYQRNLNLFLVLTIAGAIVFILSGFANGLANYLNRSIKLRLNFNLTVEFFRKLQGLPYQFFQDSSTGEHLYKISSDLEQVSRLIAEIMPQAINLIPKSLFILAIVFFLNWKIAFLALILTPFLYFIPLYFAKRLKKIIKIIALNSQNIFSKLEEILSHIQLIKVFGTEKREITRYTQRLKENIDFRLENTKLEVTGSFASGLINRIVLGLIIFFAGWQVIKGELTLGSFTAITIYLGQLSALQNSFAQFFQQVAAGLTSCERLETILEAIPAKSRGQKLNFLLGDIEFKNISFSYSAKTVLKNISFKIKSGDKIALVGFSGCGKTTLINLLLGLYKPQKGEIFIGKHRLGDFRPESFYNQVAVVLQEPYLWNETVFNNILYGKERAKNNEIKKAAKLACADEFINQLPEKYQTIIGENASKISEGQKQRIAISRALIKKPKIIILDEALSSIDGETENKIIKNIKSEFKNSLLILVSHRLSAIKKMERVYFFNNESEILVGKHEELLRKSKKYERYIRSQEIVG